MSQRHSTKESYIRHITLHGPDDVEEVVLRDSKLSEEDRAAVLKFLESYKPKPKRKRKK